MLDLDRLWLLNIELSMLWHNLYLFSSTLMLIDILAASMVFSNPVHYCDMCFVLSPSTLTIHPSNPLWYSTQLTPFHHWQLGFPKTANELIQRKVKLIKRRSRSRAPIHRWATGLCLFFTLAASCATNLSHGLNLSLAFLASMLIFTLTAYSSLCGKIAFALVNQYFPKTFFPLTEILAFAQNKCYKTNRKLV